MTIITVFDVIIAVCDFVIIAGGVLLTVMFALNAMGML